MGSRTEQRRPVLQLIIGILCQSCFNFQILFFGYVNVFTSHVNVVFFSRRSATRHRCSGNGTVKWGPWDWGC